MAFCGKCGTQVEDGKAFCPSCGNQIGAAQAQQTAQAQQAAPAPAQAQGEQKSVQENLEQAFKQFNNTADTTAEFDKQDIETNKAMAILAYIGILVLIPLLAAPQSKFARFHTNQGLLLFIFEVAAGIVMGVLGALFWSIDFLSVLVNLLGGIVELACIAFAVIGIVNAANGKAKELPLIGSIKLLK